MQLVEHLREYQNEYYQSHKEERLAYQDEYQKENRERINERNRQHKIDHPEVVTTKNAKRKERRANLKRDPLFYLYEKSEVKS